MEPEQTLLFINTHTHTHAHELCTGQEDSCCVNLNGSNMLVNFCFYRLRCISHWFTSSVTSKITLLVISSCPNWATQTVKGILKYIELFANVMSVVNTGSNPAAVSLVWPVAQTEYIRWYRVLSQYQCCRNVDMIVWLIEMWAWQWNLKFP